MSGNNQDNDRKRTRDGFWTDNNEGREANRQRLTMVPAQNQTGAVLQQAQQSPNGPQVNDVLQHLLRQLGQTSANFNQVAQAATNHPLLLPSPSTTFTAPAAVQPNYVNTVASHPVTTSSYTPVAQAPATIQSMYLPSAFTARPNYGNPVAPQAVPSTSVQGSLPLQGLALNLQQQIASLQQLPAPVLQPQAPAPASATVNSLLLSLLSQSLLGSSSNIAEQILAAGLLATVSQAPPPPSPPPPPPAPPAPINPPIMDIGALLAALQQGMAAAPAPAPAQSLVQMSAVPASIVSASPPAPVAQNVIQSDTAVPQRSSHRLHDDRAKLLYVATDEESVNAYQRFARQQIELFEAKQEDVDAGAQGRNKPIILGQVGIRCIHCSGLHPRFRARASVYYPSRLSVLYQAAQNIVNVHLPELCESIPEETRQRLLHLDTKRSAVGGGKTYWSDTVKVQGVVDTPHGLRFKDNPLPPTHSA